MRPAGFEPAAPGFEGRCSIQLSYGRVCGNLKHRFAPRALQASAGNHSGRGCQMPARGKYNPMRMGRGFSPSPSFRASRAVITLA